MRKVFWAVLLPVTMGLSACGTLNGKSPQDMMKIAMERSTKQDSSYNFSGEMRIFLSEKQKDTGLNSQDSNYKTALQEGEAEKTGQADEHEEALLTQSVDQDNALSDGEDAGNNETAMLSLADEPISGASDTVVAFDETDEEAEFEDR